MGGSIPQRTTRRPTGACGTGWCRNGCGRPHRKATTERLAGTVYPATATGTGTGTSPATSPSAPPNAASVYQTDEPTIQNGDSVPPGAYHTHRADYRVGSVSAPDVQRTARCAPPLALEIHGAAPHQCRAPRVEDTAAHPGRAAADGVRDAQARGDDAAAGAACHTAAWATGAAYARAGVPARGLY